MAGNRGVIRPWRAEDRDYLVAHARAADVAEVEAAGLTYASALEQSVARSDWTAVGDFGGRPLCVFGVAPASLLGGIGLPWMLGAEGLEAEFRTFLVHCPRVMAAFRASYPRLVNFVDERNATAIRWLRWLGFQFDDTRLPALGTAFIPFRAGDW